MSAVAIIALLTTFGPPAIDLITSLIQRAETKGDVTAAEWATLAASIKLSAADRLKAQLTAAGIDPSSAQGQAFIALAS